MRAGLEANWHPEAIAPPGVLARRCARLWTAIRLAWRFRCVLF